MATPSVVMYEYLLENGLTKAEYHWFANNKIKGRCIMGNDYYVTNEHMVHEDGHTSWACVIHAEAWRTPFQAATFSSAGGWVCNCFSQDIIKA